MPTLTLHVSQPIDQHLHQKIQRLLAGNPFVRQASSLLHDLQRMARHQLWFEDIGTVLLIYTREGEHIGYIAAE